MNKSISYSNEYIVINEKATKISLDSSNSHIHIKDYLGEDFSSFYKISYWNDPVIA